MATVTDVLSDFQKMEEEIRVLREQVKTMAVKAEMAEVAKQPIGFQPPPKTRQAESEMEMAVNEWKSFFDG